MTFKIGDRVELNADYYFSMRKSTKGVIVERNDGRYDVSYDVGYAKSFTVSFDGNLRLMTCLASELKLDRLWHSKVLSAIRG